MFNFSVIIIIVPRLVASQTYMYHFQRLTDVPKEIPSDAHQIHLDNNDISNIESGTFAENSQCWKLRLDRNKLTEVRKDMWMGLVALESLSLEHNDIQHVEPYAFADMPNLKGLYLHDNKLTTLTRNIFPPKQMPDIQILTLHDNNIQRDELSWLRELCEGGQIQEYTIPGDGISCNSRDNNNIITNNHEEYITTPQPEKYTQGEPRIFYLTTKNARNFLIHFKVPSFSLIDLNTCK